MLAGPKYFKDIVNSFISFVFCFLKRIEEKEYSLSKH